MGERTNHHLKCFAPYWDAIASGDTAHEVEELSIEECKELDAIIFECQSCNQWFHQRDNATRDAAEWLCRECKESAP